MARRAPKDDHNADMASMSLHRRRLLPTTPTTTPSKVVDNCISEAQGQSQVFIAVSLSLSLDRYLPPLYRNMI